MNFRAYFFHSTSLENFQESIAANDTVALTLGITLATTDVVRVFSTTGAVNFTLFGSEIS
jgi:hypothetical protein